MLPMTREGKPLNRREGQIAAFAPSLIVSDLTSVVLEDCMLPVDRFSSIRRANLNRAIQALSGAAIG
jgi:hypothetical protein